MTPLRLGIIALAIVSLSSCSILPPTAIATCDIPPVPELPARQGEQVVLEKEHMAELLIYFDAVENCVKML